MTVVVDAWLIWPCVHCCVVGVQGSQHFLMREACLWGSFLLMQPIFRQHEHVHLVGCCGTYIKFVSLHLLNKYFNSIALHFLVL